MTRILAVHGTNAGDPADVGDKWWQRGSPFFAAVQQYLREPLEITPLHWSGKNSELDRRATGKLIEKAVEKSAEPPIIVGHSHGASSTIHALLLRQLRNRKSALDKVRGFISIGMPMIRFKSNRNPLSWFDLPGRLLLLAILGIVFVFVLRRVGDSRGDLLSVLSSDSDGIFGWLPPFELLLAGLIFGIFAWYARQNVQRQSVFRRNTLSRLIDRRHVALNHSDDEAINALAEGLKLKPKMIRGGTMFVNVFSTVAFLLVANIYVHLAGSEVAYRTLRTDLSEEIELSSANQLGFGLGATPVRVVDRNDAPGLIYKYFTQRAETTEALRRVALRDVLNRIEPKTYADTWFAKVFDSRVDGVDLFVRDGDVDELPNAFLRSVEGFVARSIYRSSVSDDFPPPDILFDIAVSPIAAMYAYAPLPPHALEERDGQTYLKAETDIEAPLSSMVEVKWICRREAYLQGLGLGEWAESRPARCDVFDFGPSNIVDFLAVVSHGAYTSIEDAFIGSELINAIDEQMDLNFWVVLENVALLLPIMALATIAALLGMVALTPVANAFLVNTIKGAAYGNDGYGERPHSVSSSLDFRARSVGTLPLAVEEDMNMNSAADAPAAIERFRQLLSSGKFTAGSADTDALSMAMQFDRSELLHNAYFHSDLFAKYLATVLVERFGVEPSEKYRGDPDVDAFADNLESH